MGDIKTMKAQSINSKIHFRICCLGLFCLFAVTIPARPVAAKAKALADLNNPIKITDDSVLGVAQAALGKEMWFGYGLHTGKSGCAAALSNVLRQAGLPYKGSALVVLVRRQLLAGPVLVSEIAVKHSPEYGVDQAKLNQVAKPGDLIFGYMQPPEKSNTGGDAHCGVFAGAGEVYANDWTDGIWKRDVVDRFFAWYKYVYVVRFLNAKGEGART